MITIKNRLRRVVRKIRKSSFAYDHLIEVRIYKEALLNNYRLFSNHYNSVQVAPVLKSNAYGHGLIPVANILDTQRAPFFCADSFFEALILRNEGIKTPILIIGHTPLQNIQKNKLKNIFFSIGSLEEFKLVSHCLTRPTNFHIEIDTGMHRQGILLSQLEEFVLVAKRNENIKINGIFTHLADADTQDSSLTKKQIDQWNIVVDFFTHVLPVQYYHCAATAGTAYIGFIKSNRFRLGIGLYGIQTGIVQMKLQPSLSMHSRIVSLRPLASGESIGYNATYTSVTNMQVATVPAGYSEGVDRRLSNKGFFLIHKNMCQIVGRISMNISTIDVSSVPGIKMGDSVVLISNIKEDINTIEKIAQVCETIPYEILIHIPEHLRRIVI